MSNRLFFIILTIILIMLSTAFHFIKFPRKHILCDFRSFGHADIAVYRFFSCSISEISLGGGRVFNPTPLFVFDSNPLRGIPRYP